VVVSSSSATVWAVVCGETVSSQQYCCLLVCIDVYSCHTHTHCLLLAHYLTTGFDLQCRSSDNKRSNRSVCSDPSAMFTGTEIQRKCTARHNIVLLRVSVHQNQRRAPLLQKLKERQYVGNAQFCVAETTLICNYLLQ